MLETLSNAELIAKIEFLAGREREATVELLLHLVEVEKRALHVELGFGSLFDYCCRRLKYSESGASRRIRCARVLRDLPEVADVLKAGKLNICVLAKVAGILKPENAAQILNQIVGLSLREVEELVARQAPRPEAKDRIRPVLPKVSVPVDNRGGSSIFSATSAGCRPLQEEPPRLAVREVKAPTPLPAELRHEFKFTGSQEFLAKVEQARSLLGGKFPKGVSLEAVFNEALDLLIEKRSPERRAKRRKERSVKPTQAPTPTRSRHIPTATRDQVFVRDGGRCCFTGEDGTRCNRTHDLEIDHRLPFALGGGHAAENLRLLCRRHNAFVAEQEFGKAYRGSGLRSGAG